MNKHFSESRSSEDPYNHLFPPEAREKIMQQLVNNTLYMCVFGRYNVGKSTMINALLSSE